MARLPRPFNQIAAVAFIALVFIGCKQGRSEITVSGRVLLDGQPLPGGLIMFVPKEPGAKNAPAQIDESGNYGPVVLPVGDIQVSVDNRSLAPREPASRPNLMIKGLSPEARKAVEARNAAPPPPPPAANPRYKKIPTRYHMAETSGLDFKVEPGTQTHDINLTSK